MYNVNIVFLTTHLQSPFISIVDKCIFSAEVNKYMVHFEYESSKLQVFQY